MIEKTSFGMQDFTSFAYNTANKGIQTIKSAASMVAHVGQQAIGTAIEITKPVMRNAGSIGLQTTAATANIAKQFCAFTGYSFTTIMIIDTYNFMSAGHVVDNMPALNRYNSCNKASPILENMLNALNNHPRCATDPLKEFHSQALLIPVIFTLTTLSYEVFKKIESGATFWDKKLNS